MVDTWLEHDVVKQLPQIQAETALVAATRDLYFTVDDMAARAGTIGYEILTNLGRRYARTYRG
jgi:alanine racemase